jgi:uncharacterized membrane protein (UPF0127 family)
MRFAIDVAFLTWPGQDRVARVLGVRESVAPLRVAALPRKGRSVPASEIATLELPAGQAVALGLRVGVELPHT